jgi:hypothetical protein
MATKRLSSDDIKAILKRNPSIDAKQIADMMRMVQSLRSQGVQPQEYGLESPFSRRMAQPGALLPSKLKLA